MKKYACLLLFALSAFWVQATVDDVSINGKVYCNAYDGFANVRESATSKSAKLGEFRNGPDGAVLLEKTNDNWWKINCDGIIGYVNKSCLHDAPTEATDPNVTFEWLSRGEWGNENVNLSVSFKEDGTFTYLGPSDEGTGNWRIEGKNIIFTITDGSNDDGILGHPFAINFERRTIGTFTCSADDGNMPMAKNPSEGTGNSSDSFTPFKSVPRELDWIYGYWKTDEVGDIADISRDGHIKFVNAYREGTVGVYPDYDSLKKEKFAVGQYYNSFVHQMFTAISINNGADYLIIDPDNHNLFYFADFDGHIVLHKESDLTYEETLADEENTEKWNAIIKWGGIVLAIVGSLLIVWLIVWLMKKVKLVAPSIKKRVVNVSGTIIQKAKDCSEIAIEKGSLYKEQHEGNLQEIKNDKKINIVRIVRIIAFVSVIFLFYGWCSNDEKEGGKTAISSSSSKVRDRNGDFEGEWVLSIQGETFLVKFTPMGTNYGTYISIYRSIYGEKAAEMGTYEILMDKIRLSDSQMKQYGDSYIYIEGKRLSDGNGHYYRRNR